VYGATRTVPAWYVLSSIGGGMAFVTVMNCLFQNNDSDTTQYYVWFECTGTHNYTNGIRFIQCTFDAAYGGCVKMLSTQACFFESCNVVDTYTATVGNSMYYIGASTGGSQWASQKISFRDCNRDLQGPNGSMTWDIYLESTTDSVTIDTYEVRDIPGVSLFYPYFNFNNCTNVTVINCNGAVITNAATSGVTIGPSGNVFLTGSITGATTPNIPLPSDNAFISWSFDPVNIAGTNALSVGALTLVAVYALRSNHWRHFDKQLCWFVQLIRSSAVWLSRPKCKLGGCICKWYGQNNGVNNSAGCLAWILLDCQVNRLCWYITCMGTRRYKPERLN
jgi:hypothetical protein